MPEFDPKSKWVGHILIGSLALNVFLGGFTLARIFSAQPPQNPNPPVALDLRSLPDGVPNQIREELEESFQERQNFIEDRYREIQLTQNEIERLMSEEDFDEGALEEAYGNLRRLNMEIQMPMHEAMIEAAKDLRRDERRAFADFTSRERKRSERFRRPGEVDGSSWSLNFSDGKVELDVEELKELSRLSILEALRGLEDAEVQFGRDGDESADFNFDFDFEEDEEEVLERNRREKRRAERRERRRLEREKAREEACKENPDEEECQI